MSNKIKTKGKATEITPACRALMASVPPTHSRTMAIAPSIIAQKALCRIGVSTLPPAVILSITKEPESDEVTKKTNTRIMPNPDSNWPNGSTSRKGLVDSLDFN